MTKEEIINEAKLLAKKIKSVDKWALIPEDYEDVDSACEEFIFKIAGVKRND